MILRRKSKQISIGNVKIGGDAPISVQSMCNTDTRDVSATLDKIGKLASAGCEIARLAVLNKDAASAIKDIVTDLNNKFECYYYLNLNYYFDSFFC